jgi:redox-sensitive bicupin YhaK (pirin superfamily)
MGKSRLGWLDSTFHFSFADYFDSTNMNFGVLRVVNDDYIQPNSGFGDHPHRDMEIVSYVVHGSLTHADSMGTKNTISRGHVQYMSAGTGVIHSEYNRGDQMSRLLQIWILPDKKGRTPRYGQHQFQENERKNQWLKIVSNKEQETPIQLYQDCNMYVGEFDEDQEVQFELENGRQAYLIQIEGTSNLEGHDLQEGDAAEVVDQIIVLKTKEKSHYIIIEMNQ